MRFSLTFGAVVAFALAASMVATAQTPTVEGFHDRFEGGPGVNVRCAAEGWASDPTQPGTDVTVRVIVDGTPVATGLANLFRQDLLDAGIGVDGTAAFDIDLTGLVTSGVQHEVRVQAQDLGTGQWADLHNTPRFLACTGLFGYHDGNEGVVSKGSCLASGWAFDADTPTTRVQVRVKVDGKVVAEDAANEFRPDVRDAGFGDGFSGWTFDLFGRIQPTTISVVTVEARDTAKRLWLPLEFTDKQLTCGR